MKFVKNYRSNSIKTFYITIYIYIIYKLVFNSFNY